MTAKTTLSLPRVVPVRGRSVLSFRAPLALFLALALAGCATLAPGADPKVVRTEQALASADVAYAVVMEWYFRPGVVPLLKPDQIKALELVRTGYGPAYAAVQGALDGYKAGRAEGLTEKKAALKALLEEAGKVLTAHAGPLLSLWED